MDKSSGLRKTVLLKRYHFDLILALVGVPDQYKLAAVQHIVVSDSLNFWDSFEEIDQEDCKLLHVYELALLLVVAHLVECAYETFVK